MSRRPYAARLPIEERREQLLDAALRIIARNGYRACSIEAIAREAGVTRPVVYGAFDDLGALLRALLDRSQVRALAQLAAIVPGALPSTREDVASLAARGLAMVRADPDLWRPILIHDGAPAALRERVDGDRDAVRAQLAEVLAAHSPGLDAEVAAHAVIAVAEHFGRLALTEPERFEDARLAAAITALLPQKS